ncbi:MarR family winged helix-turn-helix transcriptional regulator [Nitrospirillum sp. BR 11163]|uniref:MarR family winged helix-turn-helix transcriptional regulator n=1 Tax=Nitrospirillum sp. BR 11163 TaxID=3104323 RepID=UPI002AFFD173|nr:MarR family transcriptional regulator [Nitrospirillum sp. BR 11163]MEA1672074.1 MarR family transcriptional regulator [Nitrospirillum sp. BR 11163]
MTTDHMRRRGPLALGGRLRRLTERIDEDARRVYAEFGVAFEQRWWGVMEQLMEGGAASVSELARALGISQPSVSQTRRSMEAAGLIETQDDPRDARSRRIDLSAQGRALYARLEPVWAAMDVVAMELDAEAAGVITTLDRLDAALARSSLYERLWRVMGEGR